MKNNNKEQIDAYTKFSEQLTIATSTNKFLFNQIGIGFGSIIIFGIFFFLILAGLYMGFLITSITFDPSYQLFRKLLRLNNLPLQLPKPPLSRIIFNVTMLIIPVSMVLFGVRGLLGGYGPLNFSLVYELIRFFFFR